jgi:hypothetical protein
VSTADSSHPEFLHVVYEEQFAHCRHIEVMRQGFTGIWAAIVAGVLTFVGQSNEGFLSSDFAPVVAFLIVLTTLGLLVSWRSAHTLRVCIGIISSVSHAFGAQAYDPVPGWDTGLTTLFRFRIVYVLLYAAVGLGEAAWLALILR